MKNLFIMFIISLVFARCGSKELGREEAFKTLKQEMNYPKVYDYDLYCSDPTHASRIIEAGLESKGLVTVKRTQKMKDIGSPMITLNDNAKSYLLPTTEEERSRDVLKVKIADEDIIEVTGIKTENDGKIAMVEFTKAYTNITPFAALLNKDLKKQTKHTAKFVLYDDGWRLEKGNKNISSN